MRRAVARAVRGATSHPLREFTPACVGTTELVGRYPALGYGSPPRMWGQRANGHLAVEPTRFTPTHVGTTTSSSGKPCTIWVHPHARGDNLCPPHGLVLDPGSPPRTWGQQNASYMSYVLHRFTPTHVGTTGSGVARSRDRPVHPHARGDNATLGDCDVPGCGSPPRTWGQRAWRWPGRPGCRFTPTHVGTTLDAIRRHRDAAVHPHARGDNRLGSRVG